MRNRYLRLAGLTALLLACSLCPAGAAALNIRAVSSGSWTGLRLGYYF